MSARPCGECFQIGKHGDNVVSVCGQLQYWGQEVSLRQKSSLWSKTGLFQWLQDVVRFWLAHIQPFSTPTSVAFEDVLDRQSAGHAT